MSDGLLNENKRDVSVDVLKGVGILLMVFGHVKFSHQSHLIVQSFHMPLFFTVSGFLYKEKPLKEFLSKKAFGLLLPYAVWGAGFLIFSILQTSDREIIISQIKAFLLFPTHKDEMVYSAPLWFLPALFWVELIFNSADKIKIAFLKPAVIPAIGLAGYLISLKFALKLPFAIGPALFSVLFFYAGYLLKKVNRPIKHRIIVSAASLAFPVSSPFIAIYNGYCDIRSESYRNPLLFLLTGIGNTAAIYLLIKCCENVKLLALLNRPLAYCGRNTMVFLCLNYFLIIYLKKVIKYYVPPVIKNNKYLGLTLVFIMTITVCVIAEIIIGKLKLDFVLGKKRNKSVKG